MIERVILENFKCFEYLDLECSNLNVLTGINSTGKSSLIQALLLLRQAYEVGRIENGLHLNGDIINLGLGQDLLYDESNRDVIGISLIDDGDCLLWNYQYEPESDYLRVFSLDDVVSRNLSKKNLFSDSFSYIAADRIGPQRYYRKSYHDIHDKNQVGYRGDLFVDFISERGNEDRVANEKVFHPMGLGQTLLAHTEAWLSEISPGVNLEVVNYKEAGVLSLGYRVNRTESARPHSAINVGFGISYVAPIVIALLKAKKGDLVILENPEAHLHPRGQRKMGELIAKAASGGVQIILETHSDHLLNGIRLSVKKRILERKLIRINYFYIQEGIHQKISPAILDDGSLSSWPDGFFDEWDKAMDELF